MKKYLSEQIGDDYKKWSKGDKVLISTPTGSGKTTFISQILLPYATERNEKVIYICNRRALKDQDRYNFRRDLERKYPNDAIFVDQCLEHIFVQTYQYCEQHKAYPRFNGILSLKEQEENKEKEEAQCVESAQYYIFDEAHYFICDSLFNQGTNYWNSIFFKTGISIFLTATPEPLLLYLNRSDLNEVLGKFYDDYPGVAAELHEAKKARMKIVGYGKTEKRVDSVKYNKALDKYYNTLQPLAGYVRARIHNTADYIYIIDEESENQKYDYYEPHYFHEYTDLFNILKISVEKNEKSLIFVDNEKHGIQLCEQLKNILNLPIKSSDVVFISSPIYKSKETKAVNIYNQIKEEQKFDCKILIATSMFDCGISIVDESKKM